MAAHVHAPDAFTLDETVTIKIRDIASDPALFIGDCVEQWGTVFVVATDA